MQVSKTPKSEGREAIRRAQIAFLDTVAEETGLSLSRIATRARVTSTTLTRFRNKSDYGGILNAATIGAIAAATGIPAPKQALGDLTGSAFVEDAAPFDFDANPAAGRVQAFIGDNENITAWTLNTEAISRLGFHPGDVVLVDLEARPRAGDAVCAQVIDFAAGTAETVFRLYLPPALIVASTLPFSDPNAERIHIVDDDRVQIRGVVTELLRPAQRGQTSTRNRH